MCGVTKSFRKQSTCLVCHGIEACSSNRYLHESAVVIQKNFRAYEGRKIFRRRMKVLLLSLCSWYIVCKVRSASQIVAKQHVIKFKLYIFSRNGWKK